VKELTHIELILETDEETGNIDARALILILGSAIGAYKRHSHGKEEHLVVSETRIDGRTVHFERPAKPEGRQKRERPPKSAGSDR